MQTNARGEMIRWPEFEFGTRLFAFYIVCLCVCLSVYVFVWVCLWTWERWQWSGTLHSQKHYWSLTIRLFSIINRTLVVGGGLALNREAVDVINSLSRLGHIFQIFNKTCESSKNSWLRISRIRSSGELVFNTSKLS